MLYPRICVLIGLRSSPINQWCNGQVWRWPMLLQKQSTCIKWRPSLLTTWVCSAIFKTNRKGPIMEPWWTLLYRPASPLFDWQELENDVIQLRALDYWSRGVYVDQNRELPHSTCCYEDLLGSMRVAEQSAQIAGYRSLIAVIWGGHYFVGVSEELGVKCCASREYPHMSSQYLFMQTFALFRRLAILWRRSFRTLHLEETYEVESDWNRVHRWLVYLSIQLLCFISRRWTP